MDRNTPKVKGFSSKICIFPIFSLFSLNFSEIKEIKSKDDVDFSSAAMVTQKTGKITSDYTILSPPLGKGIFRSFPC